MNIPKRKPRETLLSFDPLNSPVRSISSTGGDSALRFDDKENEQWAFFHPPAAANEAEGGEAKVNKASSLLVDLDSPIKQNSSSNNPQHRGGGHTQPSNVTSSLFSSGETPVERREEGPHLAKSTLPTPVASLDDPATPTVYSTTNGSINGKASTSPASSSHLPPSSPELHPPQLTIRPNLSPTSLLSSDDNSCSVSITPTKTISTTQTLSSPSEAPSPTLSQLLGAPSPASSSFSLTDACPGFSTALYKGLLDESPSKVGDSSFTLDASYTELLQNQKALELNTLQPSPSSRPPRPAAKATPIRIRALKASTSSSLELGTPPASSPSSLAGCPTGGVGDETFRLEDLEYGEEDASFYNLLRTTEGPAGTLESIGEDDSFDLGFLRGGRETWKREGEGAKTVKEDATVEELTAKKGDPNLALPTIVTTDSDHGHSVPAKVFEPSRSLMASVFHPMAETALLLDSEPPPLAANTMLTVGSFNGGASVFPHAGDATSLLEDVTFVIEEAGDVTMAPLNASTFKPFEGDTTVLLDQRPLSRLGNVTFDGGSSLNGNASIFFHRFDQSQVLEEETPFDEAGEVTFICEDESPRKPGGAEDESRGVFSGKVTEDEVLQRHARRIEELARRHSTVNRVTASFPSSSSSTSRTAALPPPSEISSSYGLPSGLQSTPRRVPFSQRPEALSVARGIPFIRTPRAARPVDFSNAAASSSTLLPPSSSRSTPFLSPRPPTASHRRSSSLASPFLSSAISKSPSARALNRPALEETRPAPNRGHGRSNSASSYRRESTLYSRGSSSTLAVPSTSSEADGEGATSSLSRFGGHGVTRSPSTVGLARSPSTSSISSSTPRKIRGAGSFPEGGGGALASQASPRPSGIRPSSSSSSSSSGRIPPSTSSSSLRHPTTFTLIKKPSPPARTVALPASSAPSPSLPFSVASTTTASPILAAPSTAFLPPTSLSPPAATSSTSTTGIPPRVRRLIPPSSTTKIPSASSSRTALEGLKARMEELKAKKQARAAAGGGT